MNQLSASHFINKFSVIPDDMWTIAKQSDGMGRHCAMGLCNPSYSRGGTRQEYEDIQAMFSDVTVTINRINSGNSYVLGEKVTGISAVTSINNDEAAEYTQRTPKARILAALHDIKIKEEQAEVAVQQAQQIINSPVNEPAYG